MRIGSGTKAGGKLAIQAEKWIIITEKDFTHEMTALTFGVPGTVSNLLQRPGPSVKNFPHSSRRTRETLSNDVINCNFCYKYYNQGHNYRIITNMAELLRHLCNLVRKACLKSKGQAGCKIDSAIMRWYPSCQFGAGIANMIAITILNAGRRIKLP